MIVQRGKSDSEGNTGIYSNVCPPRTLRACFRGYKISCCSTRDCSRGEVCCFVNSSCEIKCMKPMRNGFESHFLENRDNCMAYAKPARRTP
ncbi:hypothetical protein AVEN_94509-1 [Araneus ventricosus]|uniref:WAP domain-containing protein n=1 Tax=Araneus ventricosus TaxID=182803 RepID=A0A4Y2PWV5_ARAVE|nr:hypothetical protein AVEN_94509-1 [Araneus ventricosus]